MLVRGLSVVVALLLSTGLSVSPAWADTRVVALDEIAPTQTEVGRFAAQQKLKAWKTDARRRGISLERYASTVLRRTFADAKLPAIRDHKGVHRNLDGHHRLAALHMVAELTGVEVPVQLDVTKSYEGKKLKKYAKHFVNKMGEGYFGANPPKSDKAKVKSLPKSYAALRDSPMRSLTGILFKQLRFKGHHFRNYAQFYVGAHLEKAGLLKHLRLDSRGLNEALKDSRTNAQVLAKTKQFIRANPHVTSEIEKLIKPGKREKVAPRIAALKTRAYHSARKNLVRNRRRSGQSNALARRQSNALARRHSRGKAHKSRKVKIRAKWP